MILATSTEECKVERCWYVPNLLNQAVSVFLAITDLGSRVPSSELIIFIH